ncbi:putative monovalent cation/H+ antiporter subunit G [Corynebacterium ciconiae DSM 44920]|uniref:Na+/H+ antiporter subunit G n=1 Tax=Corynebacterium ciconiae TaxID=227319 RepID=UPI00036DD9F9|nr:Na+/H+ antiporter subunit G [Corynebacterium ciconiae]WKD62221.1 putative monovalent cation/H+ antiporter subunit G [Corynebacterium ciconiae DSM 44920]
MPISDIIVGALVLLASFLAMVTVRSIWEAKDALTRVNLLSPLTGVALPLLIIANLVHDFSTKGIDPNNLVRAIISIAFLLAVVSVSSFYLARAIYGVSVDDRVRLAHERAELTAAEKQAADTTGTPDSPAAGRQPEETPAPEADPQQAAEQ